MYNAMHITNFKLKPALTMRHNGLSIASEAGMLIARPEH